LIECSEEIEIIKMNTTGIIQARARITKITLKIAFVDPWI
jgi:hypothetical protein